MQGDFGTKVSLISSGTLLGHYWRHMSFKTSEIRPELLLYKEIYKHINVIFLHHHSARLLTNCCFPFIKIWIRRNKIPIPFESQQKRQGDEVPLRWGNGQHTVAAFPSPPMWLAALWWRQNRSGPGIYMTRLTKTKWAYGVFLIRYWISLECCFVRWFKSIDQWPLQLH